MNRVTNRPLGVPRIVALLFFLALFAGAIVLAHALTANPAVRMAVADFGYLGVIISGVIAGLNLFVPVPAATLTPLFTGAGLTLPLIVLSLALGTLIADFTGFAFGHVSRTVITERYPRIVDFFTRLHANRSTLVLPVVFLYAALVPFPNEALLIPLALAGARFSLLMIPLFIGNVVNQTLLVYGVNELTRLLLG